MTALTRPVTRRSEAIVRDGGKRRALIVTLNANDTLTLRPHGTRRPETITFEACYGLAVKQRVAQERREKAAAKKARKS